MKELFNNVALIFFITAIMLGCASGGGQGTRIDNIPMYGQPEVERPALLKKADQDFIDKATSKFGSREQASKAWAVQGDKFMEELNFDYAMRRYNQSWLLDPNNYHPYWGFARITLNQDKVDESINFFKKAESLIDDTYQKPALLSDMGSAYTYKGEYEPSYFIEANKKFAESIDLDPSYKEVWRRWAFSLYKQGDYQGAWEKVEKAESIGARPFSETFISNLESKLPRPK